MKLEGSWDECIESSSSISVSPDKAKAKSLIDTAIGRIHYFDASKINEAGANYIFEAYYSSALEMLHAMLLLRGYKVGNHICLGYYLRDVLKKDDLFRHFDDCRYKRNSLIYYGRKMDFEVAKSAIEKCKTLIKEVKTILNN
jgi:uncharacterized protein (UPF0332 family)